MRTIWHSLAWKEWHEHKWKLASITAILFGVSSLALLFERGSDRFALAAGMLLLCGIPLGSFVGLAAASNERSRGTLRFLQALPAPMWHIAITKIVIGILTVVVPVMLTVLSFYLWHRGFAMFGVDVRGSFRQLVESGPFNLTFGTFGLLVVAASFFIWSAAAGVNRKDEVSAGAVALAVIVGWSTLVTALSARLEYLGDSARWLRVVLLSLVPGGMFVDYELHADPRYVPSYLITVTVTHLLLVAWYIRRFGKIAEMNGRSPQVVQPSRCRRDWLAPPRRSPLTAIAWKQARESGPIVLAGLAGIVIVVALFMAWQATLLSGTHAMVGLIYARVSIVFGFFVALVVGIGVCLYDVGPQLNTFWRSRPIHPDVWFFCKFTTGLAVLLTAIYVPILVIAALGDASVQKDLTFPAAVVVPGQIAVFASAVAMTCLVRHAVYAAILSIPLVYLGVVLVWAAIWIPVLVGWREHPVGSMYELTERQVGVGLIISSAIGMLVAWLAMRNDWGWKSRY